MIMNDTYTHILYTTQLYQINRTVRVRVKPIKQYLNVDCPTPYTYIYIESLTMYEYNIFIKQNTN